MDFESASSRNSNLERIIRAYQVPVFVGVPHLQADPEGSGSLRRQRQREDSRDATVCRSAVLRTLTSRSFASVQDGGNAKAKGHGR